METLSQASRLGQRPGKYVLVLTINPDNLGGTESKATQCNEEDFAGAEAPAEPEEPAVQQELPRGPLLYVSILPDKASATQAVMELLARCRHDHGHMPKAIGPFSLHYHFVPFILPRLAISKAKSL